MGRINEFMNRWMFEPWTIVIVSRDANVLEGIGDIMAGDDNSRKACDNYLVALFKFAALGEDTCAQRVNEKIRKNYGFSYLPSKSNNWDSMKRRIAYLADTHLDHDPERVVDTYLSSSMPKVNLEALL